MTDTKTETGDIIKSLDIGDVKVPNAPGSEDESPAKATMETLDIEEATPRSKMRLMIIIAILYLTLFISALDQTLLATAIPTISHSLHSSTGYTWVGASYLLTNACFGPLWSHLSSIFGRKPALLSAVAIFFLSSMLAALAPSMSVLIAARALQGTAGGGLMQMVTITISDLFSVRKRALFIGLMGMVWAVAGSVGPLIGGALAEKAGWRWCFWINLPISFLAFTILFFFLDIHNPRTPLVKGLKAIDWYGTFSLLATTLLILLGLDFGGVIFAWNSPKVFLLLLFGGLMLFILIFSEKKLATYPMIPLSIFTTFSNNAIFLLSISHSIVSMGIEFYLPLYFQAVKQYSPSRSGLLLVPMMVTEAATDVLIGILLHRTGRYRSIIRIGSVLMTLGTALYIPFFKVSTPISTIIGLEIIAGIGTAALFQTPLLALQNTVSGTETATTTSTHGLLRNLGTTLSLVLGGVIFQNSISSSHPTLVASGLPPSILSALTGENAAANIDILPRIQDVAQRKVVQEVFAKALRNMFILYACFGAVTVIASCFIKGKDLRTEHEETKTGIGFLARRKEKEEKAADRKRGQGE